jgi:hypothetical protein
LIKLTKNETENIPTFGMGMFGRSSGNEYAFGNNGQRAENELFEGAYSAEFWMYDSRIGRRWETDPVDFPWLSPYQTFNNNPIALNDPDGLDSKPGFFSRKYTPGKFKQWIKGMGKLNVAKIYGSIAGFFRKLGGAHYGGLHIPQGRNANGNVNVSFENVQPGTHGPTHNLKKAIQQNIVNNGSPSPFPTSVVGIYGGIENGDAYVDLAGNKINEGDIEGYAHVERIVAGFGWHSLFMNTGFRGFMETRSNNNILNTGLVDIGSERVPGFNFIDDMLGNFPGLGFLKGLGVVNKQTTWFGSTTAIRVVNARYTRRSVSYYFNVRYKYWRRVQSFNNTNTGQLSGRSALWRKLHNVTK